MNYRIWLSPPHLSGQEYDFIKDALASNWIAPTGPQIDAFEEELAACLNNEKSVLALNSGTAAIHLGLIELGVQKNDLVICQSNSFIASANPITYLNACPVFVDSESDTWNMCPELLETAIKTCIKNHRKPKAIIAVHIYGMPYNHDAVDFISKKYEIPVLEDSAEALGSHYKQKPCGTLGKLSVLSFNGNKIITCSAGGALIVGDSNAYYRSKHLASQAKSDKDYLHHETVGFNYRMSNLLASIGRAQLTKLPDFVEKRRSNFAFYQQKLEPVIPKLSFQIESVSSFSNRWLSCFTFSTAEEKKKIMQILVQNGIECRQLWKPLHSQPVFKDCLAFENGISDQLFDKGLCLPSGSNLSRNDLEEIVDLIHSVVNET